MRRESSRCDLTPAERRVYLLVIAGHTNSEIAASLFISMPTVKTHINRILRKTRARSRIDLVLNERLATVTAQSTYGLTFPAPDDENVPTEDISYPKEEQ